MKKTKKDKKQKSAKRKALWEKLLNSESTNAHWEIWHDSDEKEVTLHYVPEEDYSDKDVKIKMPYDQFDDLLKFMKRLDKSNIKPNN